MAFFSRIFGKKKEEDYETVLASLAADIQKRQVKLSELRLRERRSTLLVTLYTLAAWVAYVSMWYLNILPNIQSRGRSAQVSKAIKGLPVIVGPIIILFIRRIVQVWYQRKGDAEDKTLQELVKKQRSKVREIKQKTNWDSMRDLFQRYEEPSPAATPQQRRSAPPQTPQRMALQQSTNSALQTPGPVIGQGNISAAPSPFQVVPPRKQWYDKLADALLGDEDQSPGPPGSRYALICEKCFTHNGLVKESMWEDAQYICPKCHHFNASARSKRRDLNLSPTNNDRSLSPSPQAASPQSDSVSSRHSNSPPLPQRKQSLSSDTTEPDTVPIDGAAEASMMEIDS